MSCLRLDRLPFVKMTISSAKLKWEICTWATVEYRIDGRRAYKQSNPHDRNSAVMINKLDERGSPCLRPHWDWKKPWLTALNNTENQGPKMALRISDTHCSEKPKVLNFLMINDQEILSYALAISSLSTVIHHMYHSSSSEMSLNGLTERLVKNKQSGWNCMKLLGLVWWTLNI